MAPRRRILALVALLALAVSAAAAAGAWPKKEPNAADQALARKSVLHLSDFLPGSGWTTAPANLSGGASDPAQCKGPAFSEVGRITTGSASSSFKAPGVQVWSEADVMKTLAMARQDAKQLTGAALSACMRAALVKNLPAGVRFVSLAPLRLQPVGDWNAAYRALVDVSVNGTTIRMQWDLLLVLSNRVEITLMQLAPYAISAGAQAAEERMAQRLATAPLVA